MQVGLEVPFSFIIISVISLTCEPFTFIWVGKCLDDCKKLWRDHRVSVRNCVDLALLARSVDERWKGPYKGGIGLSRLAEAYLGRYLPKGDTQRSNWEMELSTRQQECE